MLLWVAACWPALSIAQPREVKPTAVGFFHLPVALQSPVFSNLTDVLGQVDLAFNMPLYKGLGIGVGATGSWYDLSRDALAPEVTEGRLGRYVGYGELFWKQYTSERTFYEFNTKLGYGQWNWNCRTCSDNLDQPGFHWEVNAAYFIHATDNLAFGLLLGYQGDASSFGPEVIGLERFPGRTDGSTPYRFLTVGLGFSTGFERWSEEYR